MSAPMSRPGFRRILRGAAPALILLLAMACDDDDPTPRALTSTTPDPVCAGSPPECTGNADIAFSVAERYSADELVFTLGLDRGADGSTDEELDVGAVLGGTHPDY